MPSLDVLQKNRMNPVHIKSARRDREFSFAGLDGDYFTVRLHGRELSAEKRIWGYTDTDLLIDLFESIGRDWQGWEGERKWSSIEGDLELSATSETLGMIRLDVRLRNMEMDDEWSISAPVFIEPGAIESIVRAVRRFFQSGQSRAEQGTGGNAF